LPPVHGSLTQHAIYPCIRSNHPTHATQAGSIHSCGYTFHDQFRPEGFLGSSLLYDGSLPDPEKID
jgi:hypothetical protein